MVLGLTLVVLNDQSIPRLSGKTANIITHSKTTTNAVN